MPLPVDTLPKLNLLLPFERPVAGVLIPEERLPLFRDELVFLLPEKPRNEVFELPLFPDRNCPKTVEGPAKRQTSDAAISVFVSFFIVQLQVDSVVFDSLTVSVKAEHLLHKKDSSREIQPETTKKARSFTLECV